MRIKSIVAIACIVCWAFFVAGAVLALHIGRPPGSPPIIWLYAIDIPGWCAVPLTIALIVIAIRERSQKKSK